MTTRLILHVGSHKTGTTAIQQALFQHRDAFAAKGILYDTGHRFFRGPKTAQHGVAHALARNGPADRELLQKYRAALIEHARDAELIVISAEPFFRHFDAQSTAPDRVGKRVAYLTRVADYFADFDVEVSIYLRRPDSFAVSHYKENLVRTRTALSFADYIAERADEFCYAARLAPFERCFTKVTVRSYEDTVCRGLVRGFFEDHRLPLSADFTEQRTRGGISAVAALWLAAVKSGDDISPADLKQRWDFLLSDEARQLMADPPGTDLWRDADQRRAFMDAALAGFDRADFWRLPTKPVRQPDWNDADQAAADRVYRQWLQRNMARLRSRQALGAAPYRADSTLPPLRFWLMQRYFELRGLILRR